MKKRLQLENSNIEWSENGRYKVNTVVSHLGVDYQNTTGGNSLPSTFVDWFAIEKSNEIKIGNVIIIEEPINEFTSLNNAINYIQDKINSPIRDCSLIDGVFKFNVNREAEFVISLVDNFTIIDEFGFILFLATGSLLGSTGNNIIRDVTAGTDFLTDSKGNNIMRDVIASDKSLTGSTGNNIMRDVITVEKFLTHSTGNNIMRDVIAGNQFLTNSTGNNIMRDVTAGTDFLAQSSGKIEITNLLSCGLNSFLSFMGVVYIYGNIGATNGQDFDNSFFSSQNCTLHVSRLKEFSGLDTLGNPAPDGDIQRAILNGVTVIYDL